MVLQFQDEAAGENEDEVGPYISYSANDVFELRVNLKKTCVEYYHNGKKFHSSFMPVSKLPLWVSQAFHPLNGSQVLIRDAKFLT